MNVRPGLLVALAAVLIPAVAGAHEVALGAKSRSALVGSSGTGDVGRGGGLRIELGLFAPEGQVPSTVALGIDVGLMVHSTGGLTTVGSVTSLAAPAALVLSWRLELGPIALGIRAGATAAMVWAATVRENALPAWSRGVLVSAIAGLHLWLPARSMGLFGAVDVLSGQRTGIMLSAGLGF